MKKYWRRAGERLEEWRNSTGKLRVLLVQLFGSAYKVGNPGRARKSGEQSDEESEYVELNRTWRQMLLEDPWRKSLMTHVSLLINIGGFLFLIFFFSGLYLPAKHPIFNIVLIGNALTLPYWLWVGVWRKRIIQRVFAAFKKKYGEHHHLD